MLSVVMPVRAVGQDVENMASLNAKMIRENTTGEFELLVMATDGKLSRINGFNALCPIPAPVSLAQAWNALVLASQGDVICCVHSDVEVERGWNEPLEEVAKRGQIAFPRVEEDGEDCRLRGIAPSASTRMPPQCCFMFRRSLYDDLGGFDEQFEGFHFEDTDFLLRAMRHGARLVECDVTVKHGRGKTRTKVADENNVYFSLNQERYSDKHGELGNGGRWLVPLPVFTPIGEQQNG